MATRPTASTGTLRISRRCSSRCPIRGSAHTQSRSRTGIGPQLSAQWKAPFQPMKTPDGKTIAPTGKKLNMQMVTVGHWTDAGVMEHEWLFWDNQTYMKQLGLAK